MFISLVPLTPGVWATAGAAGLGGSAAGWGVSAAGLGTSAAGLGCSSSMVGAGTVEGCVPLAGCTATVPLAVLLSAGMTTDVPFTGAVTAVPLPAGCAAWLVALAVALAGLTAVVLETTAGTAVAFGATVVLVVALTFACSTRPPRIDWPYASASKPRLRRTRIVPQIVRACHSSMKIHNTNQHAPTFVWIPCRWLVMQTLKILTPTLCVELQIAPWITGSL